MVAIHRDVSRGWHIGGIIVGGSKLGNVRYIAW